jgi:putative PIN family toxin of toxin-antitoxin system
MKEAPSIVIDTNVLISALRSRLGASFRLLRLLGKGLFEINISVPLVVEYEMVAKRKENLGNLTPDDIDDILDYICSVARHCKIHYLWRPILNDPNDDMILELGVSSGCEYIVTFNIKDFKEAKRFGISAIAPKAFLEKIRG